MKISVIIPTCDRQDFLQEAIDSVKAQTLSVHEIIVVNNGNTPIEKDSPLHTQAKILELPPYSGASMARNTGALQATGDYLAFLDDDDKWDQDFLKNLSETIKTHQTDGAFGERVKFFQNGCTKKYTNCLPQGGVPTTCAKTFYKAPGFGGTNFLVKAAAFKDLGGFDTNLHTSEDQDLFVRLILSQHRLEMCPEAICYVRQHDRVRLRYGALRGLCIYYAKYWKNLNIKQHLHFAKRFFNGVKKIIVRFIKKPLVR